MVFPVPGGPTMSMDLERGFHFRSQSDDGQPRLLVPDHLRRLLRGLYFSTHTLEGPSDEHNEARQHAEQRPLLHPQGPLGGGLAK